MQSIRSKKLIIFSMRLRLILMISHRRISSTGNILLLGHDYVERTVAGGTKFVCSRCGDSYVGHGHGYILDTDERIACYAWSIKDVLIEEQHLLEGMVPIAAVHLRDNVVWLLYQENYDGMMAAIRFTLKLRLVQFSCLVVSMALPLTFQIHSRFIGYSSREVIMGFLIHIIQILATILKIPLEKRGILAIVFILLFFALGILVVRTTKKRPTSVIGHVLLLLLLCSYICKLIPYADSRTKTVAPELVATLEADEGEHRIILTYYSVERWPFTISSMYNATKSYATSVDELSWIHANATNPNEFTYIISYGEEIQSVSYNIWDSLDYIPAPWYGVSMTAEFEFGEFTGDIYLYRIDLAQIDTIH